MHLTNTVVVQQKVLLLALDELDVELGVLLLLLHYDQLTHHVPEDLPECHTVSAFGGDLAEHVLEAHHVQRALLKRDL